MLPPSQATQFLELPDDVLLGPLQDYISPRSLINLSETCHALHTLFKPCALQQEAKQLLSYVLQGNSAKALSMIRRKPQLLFIKAKAKEYASGFTQEEGYTRYTPNQQRQRFLITNYFTYRVVHASPLRAMAAAGDIDLLKEVIVILKDYIDPNSQKSGLVLASLEIHAQFPDGLDFPPSDYDFDALSQFIANENKIQIGAGDWFSKYPTNLEDSMNPDWKPIYHPIRQYIRDFREHFLPKTIITTGWLFNLNHLQAASAAAIKMRLKYNASEFFKITIIGYLQRLLPTIDARLLYTNENLETYCPVGSNLIPFYDHQQNYWALGRNLCATPFINCAYYLEGLLKYKVQALKSILEQLDHPEKHNQVDVSHTQNCSPRCTLL